MRRTTALVLGTATGAALLIGAKVGNSSLASADDDAPGVVVAAGPGTPDGGPTPTLTPPAISPSSTRPRASGAPTPTKGSTSPSSKPKPTPTKTAAKPKPTATPKGPADGTYNASATVSHGRGTLSMTVTIAGHKITNIAASEASPTETNCWNDACPKLKSETLSAQSANISAISRATYTSDAYKSALAAILTKANG
jgi:uncharacterized protein with FMN-binding domain